MRSTILKALAVLVLGAMSLSSPPRADAAATFFVGCNQAFPADCQNKSDDDIRTICQAFCSNWLTATCYPSGWLVCWNADN